MSGQGVAAVRLNLESAVGLPEIAVMSPPPGPRQVAQEHQRSHLQAVVHAALDPGLVRAEVVGNRRHRRPARIGQQHPRPFHASSRFGPGAGDPLENPARTVLDDDPRPSALEWHPQSLLGL